MLAVLSPPASPGVRLALQKDMPMTPAQIKAARKRARSNLLNGLCTHRNAFTIGWCAAFMQRGRIHIVQRAQLPESW